MKKNKIVIFLALGMILSPVFVLRAEDTSTSADATTNVPVQKNIDIIKNSLESRKAIINKVKEESSSIRQDFKNQVQTIKDSASLTATEKQTQLKDLINKKIEDIKAIKDTTIADLKANVEQRVAALKTNIEARKAELEKKIIAKKDEIKKKLESKAQERIKKLLDNIYGKLNNKIEKLSEIDAKILAKINTAEVNGVNIAAAKAQYTVAKAALDKAIVDLSATKTASIDQTAIQTSKDTLRSLVKTAEDSIKAAGAEYRKIIPLITPATDTKVETETSSSVNQ